MKILLSLCYLIALTCYYQTGFCTDYYISNSGNDENSGTKSKPWKTIIKVNNRILKPGDCLLFKGSELFTGNLLIHVNSKTLPGKPITISSYGKGKATIQCGNTDGILVKNLGNIVVSNIIVKGTGRIKNIGYGIKVFNEKGNKKLENIKISGVEASGFKWAGIFVGGNPTDFPNVKVIEGSRNGYKNVLIEKSIAFDNMYYGIYMTAQWNPASQDYGNENVTIVDCVAHDNTGDPSYTANHSGSGIMIDDTYKALIEYCVSYKNGSINAGLTGGPCGIWSHASDSVLIQYCEAYENKTAGAADGGGFDFDGGVTNSIIQYCYSHDNDGPGYLMWNYQDAPHKLSKNTIRYCISANDARKHNNGGIHIGTSGLPVTNIDVYHNTIIMFPSTKGITKGIWTGGGAKNEHFRFFNNLIITHGDIALLDIAPAKEFLFAGNAYWNSDKKFLIKYDGKSFNSFDSWTQSTHQESSKNGFTIGLSINPEITISDSNPIIGDPRRLNTLKAFQLNSNSPLLSKGVNLSDYGIIAPKHDFWGTKVLLESPDVGAFQLKK